MKKVGKIAGISIGAIVALGIVVNLWLGWSGDPAPITSAANKFVPQAEWELTEEIILPPRNFCLTQICPSVTRKWEVKEPIDTIDEFKKITATENVLVKPGDDCFMQFENGEKSKACRGLAIISDYQYEFLYYGALTEKPTIRLQVTESN